MHDLLRKKVDEWLSKGIISPFQKDAIFQYENGTIPNITTSSETVKVQRQSKEKHKLQLQPGTVRTVFTIIAVIFLCSSIGLFVAANWSLLTTFVRLSIVWILVLVGAVLSVLALRADTPVWLESMALIDYAIVLGGWAMITQTYHMPGNESSFLKVLVPIAILLTIVFDSKLMYVASAITLMRCVIVAGDLWWILLFAWAAYDMIRVLRNPGWKLNILTVISQLLMVAFGIAKCEPFLWGILPTTILFVYDRIYLLHTGKSDFSAIKGVALGLYALSGLTCYGVYTTIGDLELWKPILILLPFLSTYAGICAVLSKQFKNPTRGFKIGTVYFPTSSSILLGMCANLILLPISPLVGASVNFFILVLVYLVQGHRWEENRYTVFSLCASGYLILHILLIPEGSFATRWPLSVIIAAVLLFANWRLSRYDKKPSV